MSMLLVTPNDADVHVVELLRSAPDSSITVFGPGSATLLRIPNNKNFQLGWVLEVPLADADKQVIPAKVVRVLGTEYGFQFTALSAEQRGQIQVTLKGRPAIPRSHSATQTSS